MIVLLLDLISPCMKRHEIARCCLLNRQAFWEFSRDLDALRCQERQPQQKLLGAKLVVATNRISRWWLACTRRQWLNQVAWDAARMHAFPHRTETNFAPLRRFARLHRNDTLPCYLARCFCRMARNSTSSESSFTVFGVLELMRRLGLQRGYGPPALLLGRPQGV